MISWNRKGLRLSIDTDSTLKREFFGDLAGLAV